MLMRQKVCRYNLIRPEAKESRIYMPGTNKGVRSEAPSGKGLSLSGLHPAPYCLGDHDRDHYNQANPQYDSQDRAEDQPGCQNRHGDDQKSEPHEHRLEAAPEAKSLPG